MSTFEPSEIKRVGIAVELQDGQRIMIYSDDPKAEVNIDTTHSEPVTYWHSGEELKIRTSPSNTDITITGLSRFVVQHVSDAAIDKAIETVRNGITA